MLRGITITVGTGKVNVLASCLAIDPTLKSQYPMGSTNMRSAGFQADPANTGSVLLGDDNVATGTQRCGVNLPAGGSLFDRDVLDSVPFEEYWAVGSAAGQLLNVIVTRK
jgi:hypothetical protein